MLQPSQNHAVGGGTSKLPQNEDIHTNVSIMQRDKGAQGKRLNVTFQTTAWGTGVCLPKTQLCAAFSPLHHLPPGVEGSFHLS